MMATHHEHNTENGVFIKQCVKEKQPLCVICCGKSYCVNKEECSEFLFYKCTCFVCRCQEPICKSCAINTEIFMHLCTCFRHAERHGCYSLKTIWKETPHLECQTKE